MLETTTSFSSAPPCTLVIFGASGDLAKRKLVPALYELHRQGLLAPEFTVVGFSRTPMTHEEFRARMQGFTKTFVKENYSEAVWKSFAERLFYQPGDLTVPESVAELKKTLQSFAEKRKTGGNIIFYLSTLPNLYQEVIQGLGAAGFSKQDFKGPGWIRIVLEKPFGYDLASVQALNKQIEQHFHEKQVFRIDHYLGKETVQNILVFRFGNGIFEPVWNQHYIDHVQITMAEDLGIESRGAYFDTSGTLRDMIQNHLMQILAYVAMEPPVNFGADAIRDKKTELWKAIVPLTNENIHQYSVRGQYGPGEINTKKVVGYKQEEGVIPNSSTETFVALKLMIENWRWNGVPFYIRCGKRMPKSATEISIHFKPAPHLLFRNTACGQLDNNILCWSVQPKETISLQFVAKVPGQDVCIRPVKMDFDYSETFKAASAPPYERLLLDAMKADSTLFLRRDGDEICWSILDPLIKEWSKSTPQHFPNYAAGTWGPKVADELLLNDGRRWKNPC